jgi:uncharacterized protein (TIGR02597 family)
MKLSYFFAVIVFTVSAVSVQAQTTNSLNTVPEGITTFNIPATGIAQTVTSYFSAPLSNDPVYTGAVDGTPTTVTATTPDTITVGDSPAPWTANQFASPAAPYFVKFLAGAEAGRVLRIISNTTNSLTLDTTDGGLQTTSLTATNFSVASGDTFEVFAGDTLALMFGSTTGTLVINGGSPATADTVSIFSRSAKRFQVYYFDTTAGFWKQSGGTLNASNTIIEPYAAFLITRHQNKAASSFVLTGRVAEVNHLVQTNGGTAVYDSTGYPVDVKLSQLNLPNWAEAAVPTPPALPSIVNADSIAIWDATNSRFDTYFELANGQWRRLGGDQSDQSNFVIPAGTTVSFLKRTSVSGSASFLAPQLPYSLTN